jgi:hypothetical protein
MIMSFIKEYRTPTLVGWTINARSDVENIQIFWNTVLRRFSGAVLSIEEQGAEDNVWTERKLSDRRELHNEEFRNLCFSLNTGFFKKNFTTLKTYVNLFRGYASVLNCHNVAKHNEVYMGKLRFNVTFTGNAGCFKKRLTMAFQMLLCGECYKNVYTQRRTNYPSFKVLNSRLYQISWEVLGLEWGPLYLMSKIRELLGRKSSGSGLESREFVHRDPSRWSRGTLYPHKLASFTFNFTDKRRWLGRCSPLEFC